MATVRHPRPHVRGHIRCHAPRAGASQVERGTPWEGGHPAQPSPAPLQCQLESQGRGTWRAGLTPEAWEASPPPQGPPQESQFLLLRVSLPSPPGMRDFGHHHENVL